MSTAILFYVQHLLGIGHLTRAARIVQALEAADLPVAFVSGGEPAPEVAVPAARFIQLDPARVADGHFTPILNTRGQPVDDAWRLARRAALLSIFAQTRPRALVIELYPFGRRAFRFELLPLLEAAAASHPRPQIFCSVRDVLVEKADPDRAEEAASVVERHFDNVLVHGDPRVIDFAATFPLAARIAAKIAYTGYVVAPRGPSPRGADDAGNEILVSAGGGAAGARLFDCAIAARALGGALRARPMRIVAGPHLPKADFERLSGHATRDARLAVERYRADLSSLIEQSALSISQAGYNTVLELVAARARALVVPFAEGGESEQAIRANLMAARGLLSVLDERDLDPPSLACAAEAALGRPRPAATEIALDGAATSARLIGERLAALR